MTTRSEHIEVPPAASTHTSRSRVGGGPGVVLLQEIFGVNDYVKDAARRLAELGYVVLAPDLYWRTRAGLALGPDERDPARVRRRAAARPRRRGPRRDRRARRAARAARGDAASEPACSASASAARSRGRSPPTAIPTWRSATTARAFPDALEDADAIACPMLLHFGGARSLHTARAGRRRRRDGRGARRASSATSRTAPATRSTTASLRRSTSPRAAAAPGS